MATELQQTARKMWNEEEIRKIVREEMETVLETVQGDESAKENSQIFDEPPTIICNFERTWKRLSFVHDRLIGVHGENANRDFMHALREVRDMFQNPAIIKPE